MTAVLGDGVSEGWRGMREVDKEVHWPGGKSRKDCHTPSFGRKEVVLVEGALAVAAVD